MKNYILTGTPGSGKTTLLHKLKALQYAVVEESATDVITQEQKNGIPRPWENITFIDKVTHVQIDRQVIANQSALKGSIFFDRSPICTRALCTFLKYKPPKILLNEIKRMRDLNIYDNKVFFIENLGYVEQTLARRINYKEVILFETIHRETYAEFGFNLIEIENDTVENRIKKIISYTV